jgi:signal transduction histidine kinase
VFHAAQTIDAPGAICYDRSVSANSTAMRLPRCVMASPSNSDRPPWFGRLTERIIRSRAAARISNFPPVAFAVRALVQSRYKPLRVEGGSALTGFAQESLESTLGAIVTDVVETLGYTAAMVAVYEADGALPVRAWHVAPAVATREKVLEWESQLSRLMPSGRVSLSDPALARVYVDRPEYAANLSARAYRERAPVLSDSLYDLFQPVTPESTRPLVAGIQGAAGVRQVIAVPFFIETELDGTTDREFVGNLFALKRSEIDSRDRQVLEAFARQAAAAILSDRRRSYTDAVLSLLLDIQANLADETQVLQRIVDGVVGTLDYVAAMVATYESDSGALPVRAWHVAPSVATREQVLDWENQVGRLLPSGRVSLSDPARARVYVNRPEYQANLSVTAYQARTVVTSDSLFDLFQPVTPESARPLVAGIQAALGVRQVIAVPFFNTSTPMPEFVGNLFVLSRGSSVTAVERRVLRAFAQQAAAGIRNAQLYRQAEDRRGAAEVFGKMAFSASASVHALRNKVAVVRTGVQVIPHLDNFEPAERAEHLAATSERIMRNLDDMADMLETLHEPFRHVPDQLVDVNACVRKAAGRATDNFDVRMEYDLADDLPELYTSQDMLVEAFKVLIKNAAEAVAPKGQAGRIDITSRLRDKATIEVVVADNGSGIKPEHLARIFEMRWTTKRGSGLGFGLYWTRDYIKGLGGTVAVQSVVGEGTTFTITLPVPGQEEP